jgi:hypothetical protein
MTDLGDCSKQNSTMISIKRDFSNEKELKIIPNNNKIDEDV